MSIFIVTASILAALTEWNPQAIRVPRAPKVPLWPGPIPSLGDRSRAGADSPCPFLRGAHDPEPASPGASRCRERAIGIALTGVGLALMALFVSVDGGYLSVLAGLLALGFGSGLAMTPSTEAITSSLSREKQGVASALNDVTREFGTALGVALLGALLSAGYRSSIDGKLQGIPQGTADTARDGIANALEAAPSAGPRAQDLVHAAQQSFVDGWQQAMWVGTAVMGALFVYIALRGPKKPAPWPRTRQRSPRASPPDDPVEDRTDGRADRACRGRAPSRAAPATTATS
ncbi:hypothetical protein [Nonomuraea sp. NPDC049695]|uniref:hypothetical protein n=1 Tax=Nonomuraea sp. NPDC049695 TaxID=3154734 RepID=UPI00341A22DB